MIASLNAAVDNLLWTQLNDSLDLLEELTFNRVRNAEGVAGTARLLVARPSDESLLSPIQRPRIIFVLKVIAQHVILIVILVDFAVDQSHVMPQILLIRQVGEIVGSQLEAVSAFAVSFIVLPDLLKILLESSASTIFAELHAKGFVVERFVVFPSLDLLVQLDVVELCNCKANQSRKH